MVESPPAPPTGSDPLYEVSLPKCEDLELKPTFTPAWFFFLSRPTLPFFFFFEQSMHLPTLGKSIPLHFASRAVDVAA